ncbi:MAG: prephenate dehydrogenase [Chloroflexi bacterium]|nr:prephenate dehydrogenase [Chloroflexota bacterium]
MPVQITIIGLGQVGASLGLALAAHKDSVFCVGHDKDFSIERAAQQKGAVDKTEHNLPTAVKDARLVLLALPVHQVRETLEFIAPDLVPGTVVVDTSPIKSEVANWARDILPRGCYYVGLIPTIAAEFLNETETGLDSARAVLFKNSIFLVDAPSGTPGEALQLVTNFVGLAGATIMIADIAESDGLMASTYLLPQLVSAALLNATMNQPGWKEARKVAERAYHAVTSVRDDPESLQMLSLHNRENAVRVLNAMISSLVDLRDEIEDGNDEAVKKLLQAAHKGREEWLNDRFSAAWADKKAPPLEKTPLKERLFGTMLTRPSKDKK